MADNSPIELVELLQLPQLGIREACIGFNTVALSSDKHISIVQKVNEVPHVFIVDVERKVVSFCRQISADSVRMNPASNIIALKSNGTGTSDAVIQFANLDTRCVVRNIAFNFEVLFWKWISPSTVALVTDLSVYHCDIEENSIPIKLFDRLPAMNPCQIINYLIDRNKLWSVLSGISAEPNKVVGHLQLYSMERKCSQLILGHAPCFVSLRIRGNSEPSNLICFISNEHSTKYLHINELGQPSEGNVPFPKKKVRFPTYSEISSDFPILAEGSMKYGVLYVLTKQGSLYLYELESATCIYVCPISSDTIFVSVVHESSRGFICVNRKGQVLSVAVDEKQIVQYMANVLHNPCLAVKFASRINLLSTQELFISIFNQLYESGQYLDAATIAATAPGMILRTPETISKFKILTNTSTNISPLSQYFGALLEEGCLTKFESIEICQPLLLRGRKDVLEKWLAQDKLECSEELGDLVDNFDTNLALAIYLRSSVPNKVVKSFAKMYQFEKILDYSLKVDYHPDFIDLIQNVTLLNPDKGVEFAKIVTKRINPSIDLDKIADIFISKNLVEHFTSFLLDELRENNSHHGHLQTRLLEINLISAPQIADAILGGQLFSHFDKNRIAYLCEKARLFQRALQLYNELEDIKRVIVQFNFIDSVWLIDYFGTLSVNDALDCLKAILSSKAKSCLNICLRVVLKYHKELTVNAVINLFEAFNSYEGLYHFLNFAILESQDKEVHFKYIQAACEMGHLLEVERVCRESSFYCPEKVKNYLKCTKLSDYTSLLIVCNRFNYIHELILFLYANNLQVYLKTLVKNINSACLPEVVGELLDRNESEEYLITLISSATGHFSIKELICQVEKRNKLKFLRGWLESKSKDGSSDVDVHSALCKIYIDNNHNPESFLKENQFYDCLSIGIYCAQRNPHLAAIAFEKGHCDLELLNLHKDNGMYKQAANFLVHKKNLSLWSSILSGDDDTFREKVIEHTSQSILRSRDLEEIEKVIEAFSVANLSTSLVHLLETFIHENDLFKSEPKFQNILLLMAIKADKTRVMELVKSLNNFSPELIASYALEHELFEEAFVVYKKFNINNCAIDVLIKHFDDLERAKEFAESCNDPSIWSQLGEAQLSRDLVKQAISSFIKAKNCSICVRVVEIAQKHDEWEYLIMYLEMGSRLNRDLFVESELIYAYAKCELLEKLEDFISGPNNANINNIADRCFMNNMYKAAKLLYTSVRNFPKLAVTLLMLKEFSGAVQNAKKANQVDTWKQVCFGCIDHKEFRHAQICALNIIVNAEEIDEVVGFYEERSLIAELLNILEVGVCQERAHMGIFTMLAILYSKHKPEKLKEYLDLFWQRISIPKVLKVANDFHLWSNVLFLHEKNEDFDNAVLTIISHPVDTWKEGHFKDLVIKVSNHKIHLKCIQFYLDFKPLLLNDFLIALNCKIDNPKIVEFILEIGHLTLVKEYILSVQYLNNKVINEAVNDIFIGEDDFHGLRVSIESYNNIDKAVLAGRLVSHEIIEFRRIAVQLLQMCQSWHESIQLCKVNCLYSDAIGVAVASKVSAVAEELAEWFLQEGKTDCFAACLFQCFDLLLPDVVLELAWRYNQIDLAMPFLIQAVKEYTTKVDSLIAKAKDINLSNNPFLLHDEATSSDILSITYL